MLNRVFPHPVLRMVATDRAAPPYMGTAHFTATVVRDPDDGYVQSECRLSTNTLVGDLVLEKKARFGCILSAPATMFRKTDMFSEDFTETDGEIEISARTRLSDQVLSEEPPFCRPIVALGQEDVTLTINDRHGLRPELLNETVTIPAGAIIALAPWFQFGGSSAFLIIQKNDTLREGQIAVSGVSRGGGYRFVVNVSKRLYLDMQRCSRADSNHKESILTHAMSRALELLHKQHLDATKEEEIETEGVLSSQHRQYSNLRWLSSHLKSLDGCKCDWTVENFEPEMAATAMRGHSFSKESLNSDD